MGLQPEVLVGGHPSKTAIEKTAAFKWMKKRAIDICLICSDGGFEREQRPRRPPSSHFGKSGPQLCTSGCSSHLKIFFSRTWRCRSTIGASSDPCPPATTRRPGCRRTRRFDPMMCRLLLWWEFHERGVLVLCQVFDNTRERFSKHITLLSCLMILTIFDTIVIMIALNRI